MIKVRVKGNILAEFAAAVKPRTDRVIDAAVKRLKEATPVDTGEARDGWHREGDNIVNNVPHIEQLNEGHSPQAPAHFVEAAVLNDSSVHPNGTIVRTTAR